MAPLNVLLTTFVVLVLVRRFLAPRALSLSLCGRAAMSVMLLLTGSSHFFLTDQLAAMLPPAVPIRTEIIYATGVVELMAAVGLLVPAASRLTSWCLIAFFVAVLPANIYAALNRVGVGEHGPAYLWFRVPLQILFIGWVWYFGEAARATNSFGREGVEVGRG
jgi:uncharacterized membrane protein